VHFASVVLIGLLACIIDQNKINEKKTIYTSCPVQYPVPSAIDYLCPVRVVGFKSHDYNFYELQLNFN